MPRERLPGRRPHWSWDFVHAGIPYTGGIGRFADGRVAELFLNASVKSGTAVETNARDAAVLASLALQHGATLETIRHALTRETETRAAGPIGVLLDLIAAEEGRG